MLQLFALNEWAEPLPTGVEKAVDAFACTPDPLPLPTSGERPVTEEPVVVGGMFTSNPHDAIVAA
jgi:hypothetical protein